MRALWYLFATEIIFVVKNVSEPALRATHRTQEGRTGLLRLYPRGYGTSGSEGGETGGARVRPWLSVEPCDQAVDMDRGGNGDVL